MIGIYKITSPTGKVYIGQSVNLKKRINQYKNLNCKRQPLIYRSLLKYGVDAHTFEIIEECVIEQLNNRERYYQDLFNCLSNGLNCSLVNTYILPKVMSEDTRRKISRSRTGIIFSDTHIENIRRARIGSTTPQKTKDILRVKSLAAGCKPPSWKGKVKTPEHMKNIADKLRGRTKSIEDNTITSNAMLNTILPYSTIVFDPLTGVCYYSIRDAGRCLGINHIALNKRIKKGKTHLVFA